MRASAYRVLECKNNDLSELETKGDACWFIAQIIGLRSGWCLKRPSVLLQKHPTIYETLKRIGNAEQRKLDTWSISLTSGDSHLLPCKALLQLDIAGSALYIHTCRSQKPGRH